MFLHWSSNEPRSRQPLYKEFNKQLINTSRVTLSLHRFSKKPSLDINRLIADKKAQNQRLYSKGHKYGKSTVKNPKSGRVNKSLKRNNVSLQYRTKFICEPFNCVESDCSLVDA